MIISPQDAMEIPGHDAVFLSMAIEPGEKGFVTALLKIKLHPNELLGSLEKFGIKTPEFFLIFQGCLQIKTKIFGYDVRPETIDDFKLVKDSELQKEMIAQGNTVAIRMTHFRLNGSKGSQIDILAKSISVTDKA